MFRKALLISCLLSSPILTFAQKEKLQKTAAEQKQVELSTIIDGKKIFYNEVGAPLPPLKIWRRDDVFLTNETLQNDANLIIMLFNPTCEHCELMAKTFKEHISLFKKSHLVLVAASGMQSYLDFFINNTATELVTQIQIGIDSSGLINQTFLYKALPQINIYNKERKLEKVFFGDVDIEALKPYIE